MLTRSTLARLRIPIATLAFVVVAGCTSDDVTAPPPAEAGAMTIDASSGWVYVSLTDSAIVTPSPSPAASTDWDIAFNATSVMLNGGEAGPGGVTGACLCQNAGATSTQLLAMTPASELADLETITSTPAGTQFTSETFVPAVSGWYSGSGPSAVANPAAVYLVRLDDGDSFAKVHVIDVQGASATSAGTVMLEYAVQADSLAAFGAVDTVTVDVSAGSRQVDLNTGTVGATTAGWDLELEGFTIRLNGGVSGTGNAASADATDTFANVTTAALFASAYRGDAYAGVFNAQRWYRYNLAGDNRISPSFDVYLVKRGSLTYALQIVNYYGPTGQPRHISFRFRRIGN